LFGFISSARAHECGEDVARARATFDERVYGRGSSAIGFAAEVRRSIGFAAEARRPIGFAAEARRPIGFAAEARRPINAAETSARASS
jgi:hypothetical protein